MVKFGGAEHRNWRWYCGATHLQTPHRFIYKYSGALHLRCFLHCLCYKYYRCSAPMIATKCIFYKYYGALHQWTEIFRVAWAAEPRYICRKLKLIHCGRIATASRNICRKLKCGQIWRCRAPKLGLIFQCSAPPIAAVRFFLQIFRCSAAPVFITLSMLQILLVLCTCNDVR